MKDTRIVEVKAIALERDLAKVFGGGTYTITSRYTLLTEVHLADGTIGRMYGGDEERHQKAIVRTINGPFRELLIGQDVLDIERHWDRLFHCLVGDLVNRGLHTLDLENRAIQMQALAGVDIACWDAIGKSLGRSLATLLGGFRRSLPVVAIGGYYADGKGDRELAEEMRGYARAGMAGVKLKVGRLSPREDAERVRVVREAVSPAFIIACDANQAWTVEQAIAFARAVKPYNVRWFEEPVRWYDQLRGLAEVRRAGGLPVCAGQGEISRFGCRDLMLAEAVDILNVDATIAGGITEWRRVAAMAGMLGLEMAHHEEPQVAVHLLASIPHGLFVEIFPDPARDPLWFELPAVHPTIADGLMHVPDGPGLGIALNDDIIARYQAPLSA